MPHSVAYLMHSFMQLCTQYTTGFYVQEMKEAALVQASVRHQVDLVKLRCENNKLQSAVQKAVDDKECTELEVVISMKD